MTLAVRNTASGEIQAVQRLELRYHLNTLLSANQSRGPEKLLYKYGYHMNLFLLECK